MSSKTKTTTMKEEARPVLVPKLRFPDFRGAEGWEYAPLGKLLMKSPDYGVNAAAVPFTEQLPQYLRITDISDDGTYLGDKKVSVDLEPTEEIYLDEGDIVLARTGASVGKSYRYRKEDGRLVFAGFLIRVKPNPKRLVSAYLANFLTTEQYWKWVAATSARSGQPGINSVEYSSLAIPMPADFPEQQKIAECLSSMDELMAAQARKVDALKTHKKGLMQQLFPREGETQPSLRFPEFQNAGEWKENLFGRVLKIDSGKGFKASEYSKTGIRLLQIENVGYGVTKWSENTIYLPEDYATEYPELVMRGGDIVIALNRPVTNDELKIAKIQKHEPIAILYQRVGRLEVLNDSLLVDFAFHVCRQFIKDFVIEKSIGSDQPFISLKDLYSQNLRLPAPPEQQRIASCLSSLDALITAETQKLEALKTHKKGLMQQLFPSPQEVEA